MENPKQDLSKYEDISSEHARTYVYEKQYGNILIEVENPIMLREVENGHRILYAEDNGDIEMVQMESGWDDIQVDGPEEEMFGMDEMMDMIKGEPEEDAKVHPYGYEMDYPKWKWENQNPKYITASDMMKKGTTHTKTKTIEEPQTFDNFSAEGRRPTSAEQMELTGGDGGEGSPPDINEE